MSRNPARDACSAGTRPNSSATPIEMTQREQQHPSVKPHFLHARETAFGQRPHQADAGPCDQKPEPAADSRQHEALGEHLAYQLHAPRAERRPHRNFPTPAREARQHQVRDVRAHDQQQEANRGGNQQQRRTDGGDQLLLRRNHARAPAGVAVRERCRQPSGDDRHLALRLLLPDAVGQPPDDAERSRLAGAAVGIVRIEGERRPDIDVRARREVEGGRHHPDDGIRLRIELNGVAECVRRAAVVPLPECLAEDRDAIRAGRAFLGRKHPADQCAGAQHREQIGRAAHAGNVERLAVSGEGVAQLPERGHCRHRMRLLLPVEERERRDQIGAAIRVLFAQDHQARGILVGELIEQHRLDHAEDGSVGADTEHQRQDRHCRERRLPRQRAQGVADVADQIAHGISDW